MLVTELEERIKEALQDRFTISREIGRGGMATVFLADERHPRRQVAIKVLEPQLATEMARERFLREVEFAAQLTHPNIVPIFHAGEADGLLYYVMPFIAGQTLRARLLREGSLPVEDALRIANEVADALNYAHSNGVIHRDVKPENILISNGHAVVADFGIARALCAACGDNLTIAGHPIGTPGYMSPEQGGGEDVDPRSDVYSLGTVVYEMLTGQPPFRGPTIEAIIAAKYTQPVPTLRDGGWALSDTVDAAVQRAMQLEPKDRFETTTDFVRALTPSSSGGVIPITQPVITPPPVPDSAGGDKTIAVLPFSNLSADPENQYFSDGITEDIITQLSRIKGLKVTSRTSVLQYRDTNKTLGQIGGELGVVYVLEGTVRKAGTRVRVVAQLIDAKTDKHVWAERYDRELTDIFDLQSEIAEHIADALETTLTASEKAKIRRKPTDNMEAYTVYLQGRFHWSQFTPAGIRRAIDLFNHAVELDEGYALAYAGLADSYLLLTATLGLMAPHEASPKAKEAALKALELDPDLADAHSTLGSVYAWYEWDWEAAERCHRRAQELAPTDEKSCIMLAFHLGALGRFDEGLEIARRAVELCPLSVMARGTVGIQLYQARRYEEALEHLIQAREMDPGLPPPHIALGWTYLQMGRTEEAVASAQKAFELTSGPPPREAALGCALAAHGQRAEAERIYQKLIAYRERDYVSAADLAMLASHLDRIDEAFRWLDTAVDERASWLSHLKVDPIWDRLRPDSRFDEIVRRIGLP